MPILQIVSRAFVYILVLLFCNSCFLRASIAELDGITSSQIPATENPSNDVVSPAIEPDPNPPFNLKMSSAWNQPTSSPNLTWEYTTTGNSSTLSSYEVCLGTASNLCDILSWSNNTLLNQKKFSGLSLANNTDYYILVRAVDAAGNKSSVVSSRFKKVPSVIIDNGSSISGAWNVRVKKSNHNLVCDGTETNFSDCINAGEMRSITYTGPSSCAGYTAADELGFFHWTCTDSGAGDITFKARWSNEGKALKDLISGTSWRSNMVIIKQGSTEVAASTYQSWWENAIMELPDNATTTHITLNNANTVYVVSTSKEHGGFKIGADNVTVTTLGDAILTLNQMNTTPNCQFDSVVCLVDIESNAYKFFWIEGKYEGKGTNTGLYVGTNIHPRLQNLFISNFWFAIEIAPVMSSRGLIINKIKTSDTSTAIQCDNYTFPNRFLIANSSFNNFSSYGLEITDSCFSVIAMDNLITSGTYGVWITSASGNFINNQISNMSQTAFNAFALDTLNERTTIHHLITYNNFNGITSTSNAYLTISNLVALGPFTFYGTLINGDSNNNFSGKYITDSTSCFIVGSTNPGMNATCGYQAGGPTNATFIQIDPNNWKNSFTGWLYTDDLKNNSDNLGFSLATSITNWFSFDSIYRYWADNTNLLTIPDKDKCTNCRIWDSKIKSTDTIFRNTTGDGTTQNAAFIPGATCPSWLSGNDTVTDFRSPVNTYLRNAKEIIFDEIGDDDGLCEANESCLALPNWSVDQGSGDYYSQGECLFTNGTVSNIKVYMYPNQN